MDDLHFDALTRSVAGSGAGSGARRAFLRRLAIIPAAGFPLLAATDAQARRRKKKGKGKGKKKPACPACATGEQCVQGRCVAQCAPDCAGKACGAGNGCGGACQTGSCSQCQTCQAGQCVAVADGAGCDSGNQCVLEATCQVGECTVQTEARCFPPANVCLTASCNPANGICENAPRVAGYPCDSAEVCMFRHGSCDGHGACASTPILCDNSHEHCCPSGDFQGECRLQDWKSCSSNIQCCSNSCQGGSCWGEL